MAGTGPNFAYHFWRAAAAPGPRLKKYLKLLITRLSLLTSISGNNKSLLTNKNKQEEQEVWNGEPESKWNDSAMRL